ncbi:hypothetical protein VTK56DRAFT_5103 [Thermocarpiscus australiensis]
MTVPPDGMPPPKVPANLPELVRTAFNRARASGDVHFFPTQVTALNVNSIPFQLRFSPSLANKPTAPLPPPPATTTATTTTTSNSNDASSSTPDPAKKRPFFDPFDNPPKAMLITAVPPSHILVLNKFAVVPEHFILATRAFRAQTHLLERADLDAAYACVEAYRRYYYYDRRRHHHHQQQQRKGSQDDGDGDGDDGNGGGEEDGGELFVFFNSGPHSGASQPHRHLQLLPVARMREGLEGGEQAAWEVLAGGLVREEVRRRVPFRTFAEGIGPGADLRAVYLRLYRRACEAVLGAEVDGAVGGDDPGDGEGEEARISYNLAMTRDVMVIVPRIAEGEAVTAMAEDGGRKVVGKLALNGTVLAGTALVKSQAEWDALRAEPEQLLEILGRIGIPSAQAPSLL